MLKPQSSEAVVDFVLAELRKFDQDAFIVCGSEGDNDSGPSDAKPHVCYLLQKWSNKWGAYVDVSTADEVDDGDKLTVIPKPAKSIPVSRRVFSNDVCDTAVTNENVFE